MWCITHSPCEWVITREIIMLEQVHQHKPLMLQSVFLSEKSNTHWPVRVTVLSYKCVKATGVLFMKFYTVCHINYIFTYKAFTFLQLLDAFGHKSNISLVFDYMETDLEVNSRFYSLSQFPFACQLLRHPGYLCIYSNNFIWKWPSQTSARVLIGF